VARCERRNTFGPALACGIAAMGTMVNAGVPGVGPCLQASRIERGSGPSLAAAGPPPCETAELLLQALWLNASVQISMGLERACVALHRCRRRRRLSDTRAAQTRAAAAQDRVRAPDSATSVLARSICAIKNRSLSSLTPTQNLGSERERTTRVGKSGSCLTTTVARNDGISRAAEIVPDSTAVIRGGGAGFESRPLGRDGLGAGRVSSKGRFQGSRPARGIGGSARRAARSSARGGEPYKMDGGREGGSRTVADRDSTR